MTLLMFVQWIQPPAVARESTAITIPCWYLNPRVVVPWLKRSFISPGESSEKRAKKSTGFCLIGRVKDRLGVRMSLTPGVSAPERLLRRSTPASVPSENPPREQMSSRAMGAIPVQFLFN